MSYLEIDTRSEVPIYEQIMDRIRGLVRGGTLPPGARLPAVRQLAADLEVNPNTVARAYGLLEREGVLETARRRGTLVAESARKVADAAVGSRLDAAIDRVLGEAAGLGVEVGEVVKALERRARARSGRRSRRG